jgi:hypothetical protein
LAGDGVGRTPEHADEAKYPDRDIVVGHAKDENYEPEHYARAPNSKPPTGPWPSVCAAHRRGKLGVLGVQRTLHLLKQTLLVIGERHFDLLTVTPVVPLRSGDVDRIGRARLPRKPIDHPARTVSSFSAMK